MAQKASQEQQASAGQLEAAGGGIALAHVTSRIYSPLQSYKNKYDSYFTTGIGYHQPISTLLVEYRKQSMLGGSVRWRWRPGVGVLSRTKKTALTVYRLCNTTRPRVSLSLPL